jgi:hypothetical protein
MSPFHVTSSTLVECPAADAWTLLADYGADPRWRQGVATMRPSVPGTVTLATTTDEELRFAGRTWRNLGRVTAVEEGSWFTWETTEGADAHGRRSVQPIDPGHCLVTLDLWVTPHGMERLTAPLLRRMLGRTLREDLGRFATLATQDSSARATRSVPKAVSMAR